MRIKSIIPIGVCFALAVFGMVEHAFGASTLNIVATSDGIYELQGIAVENAAAMDITVTYDTATLANPKVTQGALTSGALIAVNDTIAGSVRMGLIRTTPIQGTGVIATIAFDRVGASSGSILGMKASLSGIDKKPLSVVAQVNNAATTAAGSSGSSSSPSAAQGSGTASATPAAPVVVGSVTADAKNEQTAASVSDDQKERANASQATGSADAGTITASGGLSTTKIRQQNSVLDRFKEYRGERSVKALTALFDQDGTSGFTQDPKVALSDGKTKVKVFFRATSVKGITPNFALQGARLLSAARDRDHADTWVVEVLPEKGVSSATLIVSQDKGNESYPLIVAPKLAAGKDGSNAMTAQGFRQYLRRKQADLTGKTKSGYLNDYIATANYIVTQAVHQASQTKQAGMQ